jgi:GrpB-like predicted nucleotidyltransferase (UPF0157 family)
MSDEPVTLVDHDPGWRNRFLEQAARLTAILQPWFAMPVERVGSTAVPGLRARPVVDILAPVALAVEHRTDRDAYTEAKDDFNLSALHAAGVAAQPGRKGVAKGLG